jgi:WD40 repeat protein
VYDTVTRRVVGMVISITEPDRYGRLTETAFISPIETLRAVCPELRISDICPYQGLAAFTEADAEFFFGREKLVSKLVDHLRGNPRFLAVIGPSGSGKSSVVQAGLIPVLRQGEVPGSQDWHFLSFRPGDDPFAALVAAGLDTEGDDLKAKTQAFLRAHPGIRRLILFADQFEELFALCREPMQERFLEQLRALLESSLPVTLLLTLRADFYGHLLRKQALFDWLEVGQVNVSPMGLEELQAAVQKPALKLGLRFEPGLAKVIAEDAGRIDHPLPLLESALIQLWGKRRADGTLTHMAYESVGRVAGAISQWAEDTYSGLSSGDQTLSRHIFTRLLHYGEGDTADTRRRSTLSELATERREEEQVHQLVRRLASARLLVTGEETGTETVEIIHDSLLEQWIRLKQWIAEQREFHLWRQRLDERLREWQELKDSGALLRGAQLAEAEGWLADHRDDLNEAERDFVTKSAELQDQEVATRKQRQTLIGIFVAFVFIGGAYLLMLYGRQRNSAREARATAVVEANTRATAQAEAERSRSTAVAEAEVRATAQVQAENQAHVAQIRALSAQAQSILEQHPLRSLLLASEAVNLSRGDDEELYVLTAEQALRDALSTVGGRGLSSRESPIETVTFSPDGRWLATTERGETTVQLWDLAAPDPFAAPISLNSHEDDIAALVFSPDGRWLATTERGEATVQLWDLAAPDPFAAPIFLNSHEDDIAALVFSPDGRWLATTERGEATVQLWDLAAPDPFAASIFLSSHEAAIATLTFSPDGHWLAVTETESPIAWLWDLTAADFTVEPIVLHSHESGIESVVFSPDGVWLAIGSRDATVQLWDLREPNHITVPVVLYSHESTIKALTFSPDGNWLATGGNDAIIRMWDLTATNLTAAPLILQGHESTIETVTFSPDGRWLATSSEEAGLTSNSRVSNALLWNLSAEEFSGEPIVLSGHEGTVAALTFSPDGRWLLTRNRGAPARLWDLATADPAIESVAIPDREGEVSEVAFSSDGRWLATAGSYNEATVWLWDMKAENPIVEPMVLRGAKSPFRPLSFSPDGRWLAIGGGTVIRIWDLEAGPAAEPLVLRGCDYPIETAALSPDGNWLVTTGLGTSVAQLWDLTVTDPKAEHVALVDEDALDWTVAFSSDGRWLATTVSGNNIVRLWDLAAADPTAHPIILRGHESMITALAFSPDARWLATGGEDTTVRLWNLTAKELAADSLILHSYEQWINAVDFSPDGQWLAATEGGDTTLWLWDMSSAVPAAEPILLGGHEDEILDWAFSHDGRWLATGSRDGTAQLWHLASSNPVDEPMILQGHEGDVYEVVFGPDGRWLATAGRDNTARLWDLTASDPASEAIVLGGYEEGEVLRLNFSPDGRWLATGPTDIDAVIRRWGIAAQLWDLSAVVEFPAEPLVFQSYENSAIYMAFSPDGRWLATAGYGNIVRLWDLRAADPTAESLALRGHEGFISNIAFSSDGRWLVTKSNDAVRLWHLKLDDLVSLACRVAGRNLTHYEWRVYFPDREYNATCPNLPVLEY